MSVPMAVNFVIPRRHGRVARLTEAQLRAMPERVSMMDKRGRPYKMDVPSGYVMYAGAGFGVPFAAWRRDLWEADRLAVIRKGPHKADAFFWECAVFPPGEEVVGDRDLPPWYPKEAHDPCGDEEAQNRIVADAIGGLP